MSRGNDLAGLAALEKQVRGAVERLTALADENERLVARVAELEAGGDGASGDDERQVDAAWHRRQEEIRDRVTKLTTTLEGLLAIPADD